MVNVDVDHLNCLTSVTSVRRYRTLQYDVLQECRCELELFYTTLTVLDELSAQDLSVYLERS